MRGFARARRGRARWLAAGLALGLLVPGRPLVGGGEVTEVGIQPVDDEVREAVVDVRFW
jgi:hypothetical protein